MWGIGEYVYAVGSVTTRRGYSGDVCCDHVGRDAILVVAWGGGGERVKGMRGMRREERGGVWRGLGFAPVQGKCGYLVRHGYTNGE